jgi:23S rRNA pseudouridine1911/1915/1917 synthase
MTVLTVFPDDDGQRADRFLRKALGDTALGEIQRLLRTGQVRTTDGKKLKNDSRVEDGEILILPDAVKQPNTPLPILSSDLKRIDIVSTILYEDDSILVINKPPGINVHPGDHKSKEASIIELVQDYLRTTPRKGLFDSALVHRIDRDTSGVLIIAKNRLSLNILLEELQSHEMEKCYLALAVGNIAPQMGSIDLPILRRETERWPKVIVDKNWQRAITHYTSLGEYQWVSLIELRLETGRMHQIRVHLSEKWVPVLGDTKYWVPLSRAFASKNPNFIVPERQLLHAYKIGFHHPQSGKLLEIIAPIPEDMSTLVKNIAPTIFQDSLR